jgi:uncharacterized protein YbcC (UPF0753/DUF2309 family)
MRAETDIRDRIDAAAEAVGPVWPLHSFVTANPLRGFEDRPFHEAVEAGERLFGGDGYPDADAFRRAWENGRIDAGVLRTKLADNGYPTDPEATLERMADAGDGRGASGARTSADPAAEQVDAVLAKWLARFLDQGNAHWPMPDRGEGFYAAVLAVARHDGEIPNRERLAELPAEPAEAIADLLADYPESEWPAIFEHHLTALPGWTGFIKRRIADGGAWQSAHPITLAGYLAARLALAGLLDAPIHPGEAPGAGRTVDDGSGGDDDALPLPAVWLSAWEATYRDDLVEAVADASESIPPDESGTGADGERPDAQLAFCIDTRSEIIRRHVEAAGDYETHGYAGFFGIPMRHEGYDSEVTVDACPPILEAQHRIADRPTGVGSAKCATRDRWTATVDAATDVVDALTANVVTAFNFVETAGGGYGLALAARTLLPDRVFDVLDGVAERIPDDHEFCEPSVAYDPGAGQDLHRGLTPEEKVEYAATAFELMGWERFARVVVFAGHASRTANNPFDSSLDCGACAGNPGGPSARVLATICNDDAVRDGLRDRGIEIPEDTVFVAGEHDTTTDGIELYAGGVPESHEADVERLEADLATARAGASAERADDMGVPEGGVRETERRAADWAETRPEWGLAGNAGFVIGPRDLTAGLDLDGRAFLHSYDHSTDPDGDALEAIMTGPMVVTQWINTQYYFATVDDAAYGSGSKVTQNPVGNIGVYQGNGGDLMTGLPLQSLLAAADEPYHQPLRLSTVIHAPVERVTGILTDNPKLAELLDNDWLSLTVVDPTRDHGVFHYGRDLEWTPAPVESARPAAPGASTVADD